MSRILDLTGNIYGRLIVCDRGANDGSGRTYWICKCECDNITTVQSYHLRSGHTTSCGCKVYENIGRLPTHGDTNTRFYAAWTSMKARCKHRDIYKNISVCDRWQKYENFKLDMYETYTNHIKKFGEKNTTLERRDPFGNYSPDNCCWATWSQQAHNRLPKYFHYGEVDKADG